MPAARTTPKDVLIRVPKVEPYSNSYLPPSVRAKEEAKKLAAAAAAATTTSAEGTGQVGTSAAAGGATTSASTSASSTAAPLDATAALATPSAAAPPLASTDTAGAPWQPTNQPSTAAAEGEKEKDPSERGNSPTLPFLSVERQEDETVQLSKAATSSAAWNSLLLWARRQRGAQWDSSTALWQVNKYSKEYYTFCQDPATKDPSKQPADPNEQEKAKHTLTATATEQEDQDKGPTKVSSRNKGEDAGAAGGSPPIAPLGRTVRLLRRP
ncbi:hypothetical protein NDA18_003947 [Ustilago nuda]|nr:hypothetical protein NDA18_003947 [Ustilago nuda]